MAPLPGWGPSGQRLEASAPFGHWKTMTFIAALRHDRISAPRVIDGPINGELFTLYVEQVLAHRPSPRANSSSSARSGMTHSINRLAQIAGDHHRAVCHAFDLGKNRSLHSGNE